MFKQEKDFKSIFMNRKGEKLDGSIFRSEERKLAKVIAIHFHGSWGNFYENPFALGLAETYNKLGIDYASVNLSSHDGGTVNEDFAESVEEISAWVEFLTQEDTKVILQGHSLGALKIIRLANDPIYETFCETIAGLILLSPFDLVAFYGGPNVERRRSHAKEFRDENGPEALVPPSIFDVWPISVKTFLEFSEPEGDFDIFPTRLGQLGELDGTKIPRLVVIGEQDNACYPGAENVMAVLETSTSNSEMITNAPHNFAGREIQLGETISKFVANLDI